MGKVTGRTSYTSRGYCGLSPWNTNDGKYTILQLYLGNNPNSKLEVVSALNSFNIANEIWYYNYISCTSNYNPKVYLSAVQTLSKNWIHDNNQGLKNNEKSGSLK